MQPIGGYFSLELPMHREFHENAIKLNTGRNCLEYILLSQGYKKVFIPYYTCEVVLEPFIKRKVRYEFYHLDHNLEPIELPALKQSEAFLYTNYFGLKNAYIERLSRHYGQRLILDNTQAFYARPILGIDTFYSCRKFFGVPDGAYLYTSKPLDIELEQDRSFDRLSSLTKRIDLSAEAGYADFRGLSKSLAGQPIRRMSNFTQRMMRSIDYGTIAMRRRENYRRLQDALGNDNGLDLPFADDMVPLVFPLFSNKEGLRERLIKDKIFVAQYWPNVLEWTGSSDFEYCFASHMQPLPIDQRYDKRDMDFIIERIKGY